jgi:hypothetical protein
VKYCFETCGTSLLIQWRSITSQQECSEDFKSPKRTTTLNKHEASNDLVRKNVELNILLKVISFSFGQRFYTANTEVLWFAFEWYPEPAPSKRFKCANPIWVSSCVILFDLTWLLLRARTPLDEWLAWHRDLYLKTQHSQKTNIHAPGGIRTHNPSKRAATDPTPLTARSQGLACISD